MDRVAWKSKTLNPKQREKQKRESGETGAMEKSEKCVLSRREARWK